MTAIFIIAGIAGLVWATLLIVRGSLLGGVLAYLILACCCGPYLMSFDVAGVTLTLDRLFLLGLGTAYLVQRRMGRTDPKPIGWEDLLLGTLIGTLIVSTFTHEWRLTSPNETPIVQHLINGYLIPVAIYWFARQSTLGERSTRRMLVGLAAFGVYLAVTGVMEAYGQWAFVFPRYIADPEIGLHFGRARGPMLQSVSYGVYVATGLLCLLLLYPRANRRWRMVLVALLPAFAAALFFSKTRTVWLGAGAGLFILSALSLTGRARTAVLASMVAVALLVGVTKSDAIKGLKREGTVADTRHSVDMRGSFAYVSWKMFQDRPLAGVGFGHFAHAKLPYLTDRSVRMNLESIRDYEQHNTFLSLLTETGLIGLGLFLAVLYLWIAAAWSLASNRQVPPWARTHAILTLGLLGIVFWQMLGHEITFTPLDNSLIYMMAGVTVGLKQRLLGVATDRPFAWGGSSGQTGRPRPWFPAS